MSLSKLWEMVKDREVWRTAVRGVAESGTPGDLTDPGIEPRYPSLQVDSLPSEPPGKPIRRAHTCALNPGTCLLILTCSLTSGRPPLSNPGSQKDPPRRIQGVWGLLPAPPAKSVPSTPCSLKSGTGWASPGGSLQRDLLPSVHPPPCPTQLPAPTAFFISLCCHSGPD